MDLFVMVRSAVYFYLLLSSGTKAQTGPGVECLCFEQYAADEDIIQATVIVPANDDSDRLFVCEQRGIVWTFLPDGSKLPDPFINMTDTELYVRYNTGIFGLAFHPNFAINRLVYLYYGVQYNGLYYQRASEMEVSATDPNYVDPNTERVILDIPYVTEENTHQGGGFLFGDDGYLYLVTGDGQCCGDPLKNGQDKSNILATVLRIDVDDTTNGPYAIPPDNPFVDEPGTAPEIYAYGIRQGYRASMDTGDRVTGEGKGRIFVGDVGDSNFEEVNLIENGGNYGWSVWEGNVCHDPDNCNVTDRYVPPIVTYNRSQGACIIFGGMYRGCMNPDLNGWLLFSDHMSGNFFGAREVADNVWDYQQIQQCEVCPGNLTNVGNYIISMGHDSFGEHYVSIVDFPGPRIGNTSIYKVVDPSSIGSTC